MQPHPRCTLFPYTTLFRSREFKLCRRVVVGEARRAAHAQHAALTVGERNRRARVAQPRRRRDRKSTRLNSSHVSISYAVFCLKKKKSKAASVRLSSTSTAV